MNQTSSKTKHSSNSWKKCMEILVCKITNRSHLSGWETSRDVALYSYLRPLTTLIFNLDHFYPDQIYVKTRLNIQLDFWKSFFFDERILNGPLMKTLLPVVLGAAQENSSKYIRDSCTFEVEFFLDKDFKLIRLFT